MANFTRLLQAADFAARAHRAQRRKSGPDTPYINHPLHVARLIAEVGGVDDEEILMGALLHDVIEDTDTMGEEIEALFGAAVRRYVEEVTDDKSLPAAERKRLQIVHAPEKSPGAAIIKVADKISNTHDLARTPPIDWPLGRVEEYLIWAERVVDALPAVNERLWKRFKEELAASREALRQRVDESIGA